MISKNLLQSFISKYHVNGRFDKAKWVIRDNTLVVNTGVPGRAIMVELNNFPLEEIELGIWDTTKLNKLLSITTGDLLLSLTKDNTVAQKLNISDSSFDLSYGLALPYMIEKAVWYDDPNQWDIELDLSREDVDNLIKAKNALAEQEVFAIKAIKDINQITTTQFTFGDNSEHASKIKYNISGKINEDILNTAYPFDADLFKDILNINKDQNTYTLKFSKLGMMQLSFSSDEIKSTYYLSRNE